ncbi:MAG: D-alanyl-D-alanine carboxypeptidase family protein [Venatoribacter sp.]
MRFLSLISSLLFSFSASAAVIIPKAPDLDASSYILMDAVSGRIIVQHNADKRLPPASLTKMMTSYVALHEVVQGNVSENQLVPISVKAWKMGGSKMFVREGTEVPIIDLLRGIIIQSGNDASVAVGEYFAGSEEAFAGWMNQFAARFGMTNTNFENATGWPSKNHYSTAHDLAKLSWHIVNDHPAYYSLYAEKYYSYNGIRQPNRNTLLWRDKTVDGLKTGHTEEAGFCLAASAEREGTRLIAVVMGTRSEEARARETQKLLAYGFRYFETRSVYSANESLQTAKVWKGQADQVELGLEKNVVLTLPRGIKGELEVSLKTDNQIEAPISKGQVLGSMTISLDGETLEERPLVALNDIEEAGFFGRLLDTIKLFFARLFG